MCIAPSEIISEDHEKMASFNSLVMGLLMVNPVSELLNFFIDIVSLHFRVINNGIILTLGVKIETFGGAVMLIESVSKDLITLSLMVEEWSPNPLHL